MEAQRYRKPEEANNQDGLETGIKTLPNQNISGPEGLTEDFEEQLISILQPFTTYCERVLPNACKTRISLTPKSEVTTKL